ncbi:Cilia- and flagella-associated protein 251, partial [Quaeritorhiza haematococci]
MLIIWDTYPQLGLDSFDTKSADLNKPTNNPPLYSHRNSTDEGSSSPSDVTRPKSAGPGTGGGGGPPPLQALPIKTIFDPHGGAGVLAATFSDYAKYLITLGSDYPQTLSIWDWTSESDNPLGTITIDGEYQSSIKVNPEDPFEILTTGSHAVYFFTWDFLSSPGSASSDQPSSSDSDLNANTSGERESENGG